MFVQNKEQQTRVYVKINEREQIYSSSALYISRVGVVGSQLQELTIKINSSVLKFLMYSPRLRYPVSVLILAFNT